MKMYKKSLALLFHYYNDGDCLCIPFEPQLKTCWSLINKWYSDSLKTGFQWSAVSDVWDDIKAYNKDTSNGSLKLLIRRTTGCKSTYFLYIFYYSNSYSWIFIFRGAFLVPLFARELAGSSGRRGNSFVGLNQVLPNIFMKPLLCPGLTTYLFLHVHFTLVLVSLAQNQY